MTKATRQNNISQCTIEIDHPRILPSSRLTRCPAVPKQLSFLLILARLGPHCRIENQLSQSSEYLQCRGIGERCEIDDGGAADDSTDTPVTNAESCEGVFSSMDIQWMFTCNASGSVLLGTSVGLSDVFCVQRWQLLHPSQSQHVADSYVKDVSAPQKAEQTQVYTENSVSNIRY